MEFEAFGAVQRDQRHHGLPSKEVGVRCPARAASRGKSEKDFAFSMLRAEGASELSRVSISGDVSGAVAVAQLVEVIRTSSRTAWKKVRGGPLVREGFLEGLGNPIPGRREGGATGAAGQRLRKRILLRWTPHKKCSCRLRAGWLAGIHRWFCRIPALGGNVQTRGRKRDGNVVSGDGMARAHVGREGASFKFRGAIVKAKTPTSL